MTETYQPSVNEKLFCYHYGTWPDDCHSTIKTSFDILDGELKYVKIDHDSADFNTKTGGLNSKYPRNERKCPCKLEDPILLVWDGEKVLKPIHFRDHAQNEGLVVEGDRGCLLNGNSS